MKLKKAIKSAGTSKPAIYLLYLFIRVYLLSVKVRIVNEAPWLKKIKKGDPVLLCMFHQQFFCIVRFFRKYLRFNPCMMISRSRDGDIGAWFADFSGCKVVRGSSSRGGKEAMSEMINYLESRKGFCINLVDGPQGPLGKVKPGSIRIAQKSRAWLVPVFFTPDRYWQAGSWDKFVIPKPFARVRLAFNDPFKVDAQLSDEEFDACRRKLEMQMTPYLLTH